jgi:hypothetical protein
VSEHPGLDRVLKDLPGRRAPAGLEARVLAEVAGLQALPWWRRRFGEWPLPYSAAFLTLSSLLAVLAGFGGRWVAATPLPWASFLGPVLALLRPWLVLGSTASDLAHVMSHAVPAPWLYGALLVGASLYVALFAIGATAYRALYLRPLGQVKS